MTVAELMRGGSKAKDGINARGRLRTVQGRVAQARTVTQAAGQAAERGRAAVARAQEAAAVYSGVDEAVAAHRADSLRAGANTTELPRYLVDGRRRQQAAQLELADAVRAAGLLEQDERAAQVAVVEAESELRAAVDRVMQNEAAALAGRLRERERETAADRLLLGSFLAIRTFSDPPVAWGIESVMLEPIHRPALDVAIAAGVPAGEPVWRELKSRLLVDADAGLTDG